MGEPIQFGGENSWVSVANEVGDGATSRVYVGTMNTEKDAVKKLKGYTHNQASFFTKFFCICEIILK